MSNPTVAVHRTIEDVAAERGMAQRDCQTCPHYEAQGDGLGYGWCRAHRQFVKLYRMPEGFWSQCQFKALTRERDEGGRLEDPPAGIIPGARPVVPVAGW